MTTGWDALLFAIAIILWVLSLLPPLAAVRLQLVAGGLIAFALPFLLVALPGH